MDLLDQEPAEEMNLFEAFNHTSSNLERVSLLNETLELEI
jgi:hypothetical protein